MDAYVSVQVCMIRILGRYNKDPPQKNPISSLKTNMQKHGDPSGAALETSVLSSFY